MIRYITIIAMLLLSNLVNAECINDIDSEESLVLSNMCVFPVTALVSIKKTQMKQWYNPMAYFRPHRTYIYEGKIIEVLKGNASKNVQCFIERREGGFDDVSSMIGKDYIISYDSGSDCSLIDVGAMVLSNQQLLTKARGYVAK